MLQRSTDVSKPEVCTISGKPVAYCVLHCAHEKSAHIYREHVQGQVSRHGASSSAVQCTIHVHSTALCTCPDSLRSACLLVYAVVGTEAAGRFSGSPDSAHDLDVATIQETLFPLWCISSGGQPAFVQPEPLAVSGSRDWISAGKRKQTRQDAPVAVFFGQGQGLGMAGRGGVRDNGINFASRLSSCQGSLVALWSA